jgi:hypothetical protein
VRTLAEAYHDAPPYLAIQAPYDEFVAAGKGDCSTVDDAMHLASLAICRGR